MFGTTGLKIMKELMFEYEACLWSSHVPLEVGCVSLMGYGKKHKGFSQLTIS